LTDGRLTEDTRESVLQSMRHAVNDEHDLGFRERYIQLTAGASLREFETVVRDGLDWIMDVLSGTYRVDHPAEPEQFPDLSRPLSLRCELVPDAVAFLRKHPLRLMTLDDHQQLLGKYVRNGCGVSLWYQYTPPEKVGKVHARWIELVNRGSPNSMGFYYRLFRHPALCLPVIYHEYLHYAGTGDTPDRGIGNPCRLAHPSRVSAR